MVEFFRGCKRGEKSSLKKSSRYSILMLVHSVGSIKFKSVVVWLVSVMLEVNIQILRTSGGCFQDGVQTFSEA